MRLIKIHCLYLSFFLFNTFVQADSSSQSTSIKHDTVIPIKQKKDTEIVLKAIIDSNRSAIDSNLLFAASRIRTFLARQKDSLRADSIRIDSINKVRKSKPK